MNSRILHLLGSILVGIICVVPCLAQDVISLEDAIYRVIEKNLEVDRADIGIRMSELELSQAQHNRYPSVSGTADVGWNFGRAIDPTTNDFVNTTFFYNNYGINSGVSLFNGFSIKNNIVKSKYNVKASLEDKEYLQESLALQVAQAFLSVLFAQENLKLAEANVERLDVQMDQIQKLIDAGSLATNEILIYNAQKLSAAQVITVTENSREQALLQLRQLLRLTPEEEVEIVAPEEVEFSTDPDMVTMDELYKIAEARTSLLQGDAWRIKSAEMDIKLAQGGKYPSLVAFGNLRTAFSNQGREIESVDLVIDEQVFEIMGQPVEVGIPTPVPNFIESPFRNQVGDNLAYGVGFQLNVPIYNNHQSNINIQRAKLGLQGQQITHEQNKDNLRTTLQASLSDARAFKKTYEASQLNVEAQRSLYENVQKKLQHGAANNVEWQNAELMLSDSQTQLLIDRYNYLFSIKVLEFYLGKNLKL